MKIRLWKNEIVSRHVRMTHAVRRRECTGLRNSQRRQIEAHLKQDKHNSENGPHKCAA